MNCSRFFLLVALLCSSTSALATTFIVNTTADTFDGTCDADCSLKDAIFAAESAPGPDDVVLQYCETYTISTPYQAFFGRGLPPITTTIVIHGNGATIQRAAGALPFNFFDVRVSGDLTLQDLTMRNGLSQGGGGAVASLGRLRAINSVFESNASINVGWGGAIFNNDGIVEIEHCTFRGNSATQAGGAILSVGSYSAPAGLAIEGSSIVGNSTSGDPNFNSPGDGGGIEINCNHQVLIRNTTVSDNVAAGRGGGIIFHSIPADPPSDFVFLTNVTVTKNSSSLGGGGLFNSTSCPAVDCGNPVCGLLINPTLTNTIVAGNSGPSSPDWAGNGRFTTGGHNLIGNTSGNTFVNSATGDLLNTPAGLGLLEDLGEAGGQYHPPLAASLAVNHADPAFCSLDDQLELGRVLVCDIGAIEFRSCLAAPTGLVDFWRFDETSGAIARDEAGAFNNQGAYQNGPVPSPGMVRHSLCFNGIDQSVRVADQTEVNFLGDCSVDAADAFTIDAWVKTCQTGLQVILDKREFQPGFIRGYHLFIFDGRLGFQLATGPAFQNYVAPLGPDLRDGRWHFVAVTVARPCRAVGAGRMYIDRNLVYTFAPLQAPISNAADLLIGERHPIPVPLFFEGCIDELEFFQRDLTAAEVAAIFDAGWAGKCPLHISPFDFWVGLKNSDDQGTNFDLKVELLKNGVPVTSGLQRCITGVTRNPSLAKEGIVEWDTSPPAFSSGDVLALRVSTRIGTNEDDTKCGTGHNNGSLRLYYDSAIRLSRFDWDNPIPDTDLYLHSDGTPCGSTESAGVTTRFLDPNPPTASIPKCKDSGVLNFANGNPFSLLGTWSLAPLP